jgi:predicted metal-dependent peptidase
MILRARARYDFSRYLRRYSSMKEEIKIDQSGFDFIPYYYGLKRYGNMPLIEPLEYSESYKVEDLVIAIDTSGSCTIEIVERFLAEIEHILMQKENFFRRMNVHIVQCDARIQSHVSIHSIDEWKEYIKDLSIKGRGGTDFNPVFDLVARLQKNGELRKLKGLLYFTDGNGVYPQEETPYETAFVFTSKAALGYNIPKWIVPLCLDMDI